MSNFKAGNRVRVITKEVDNGSLFNRTGVVYRVVRMTLWPNQIILDGDNYASLFSNHEIELESNA